MSDTPTLESLAADLASGRSHSRTLVEQCLAHIDEPDGEGSRTFVQVERAGALAQADAIDALRSRGAAPGRFAGIPISIKDLFDVAGQVTRAGSIVLAQRAPASADAASVSRLRAAGLVLIGRTNMTEFAFSGLGINPHYGTPRNPWQRTQQRLPGGSSSGAAISVTDGMAHAGLGTDTGGSCRIPAAFTGLVGYKPTARRVPQQGMIPLSSSLDSIGPIARSVSCCAALDALLAGQRESDPAPARLAGSRWAVARTVVLENMEPLVARCYEQALSRLTAAGAQLEDLEIPEFAQLASINAKGTLSAAESFQWHRELLSSHSDEYDPRVLSRIQAGAAMSGTDYQALLLARRDFIRAVEARLAGFEGLLMPTVPIVAPPLHELAQDSAYYRINALVLRNSALINFLDGCAISIPIQQAGAAPVGLTLAACAGRDRQLLALAAAAEAALRS